jgi:hypothetical protein
MNLATWRRERKGASGGGRESWSDVQFRKGLMKYSLQ